MPSQKVVRMVRHGKAHVREALQDVAETAPCFIATDTGHSRVGSDRIALFEVLVDAYLVQSVTQALYHLDTQCLTGDRPKQSFRELEHTLMRARANLTTSQQVLRHALVTELGDRPVKMSKARTVSYPPGRLLAPVLPFRKPSKQPPTRGASEMWRKKIGV